MNEHCTGALQYGHLGKLKYDSETQTWRFPRSLTPAPSLHYAGVTKTTVPPPLTVPQSSSIENKSLIPQAYPELGSCWPQIRNETLSNAISRTYDICDPLVASLLDLGYAVDFENDDSGNRLVPIAAVVSGECGNAITLYRIEDDTVELRQDAAVKIRVPSIGRLESVQWSLGGAPVQQICFGQTLEEKTSFTWMAVRFPHSTRIFRPLYHRQPISTGIYGHGDSTKPVEYGTSRLDANLLVEISCQQTGGVMHADVAFNPWYPQQLGIVDVCGNWGIWNLSRDNNRNKGNWTSDCSKSGSLPWLDNGDGQDTDNYSRHDGWAAIEWASNYNSFIVSDRRCPILYRIEDNQVSSFPIELDLKSPSEWILDIKRSTCNVSHVFILTTSRVFWIDIALDHVSTTARSTTSSLYPRLFWRHFRDPEDTTLQLAPLLANRQLYLVLSSRLHNLVMTFHCPNATEDYTDVTSVPDPFVLEIPPSSDHVSEYSMPRKSTQFSLCFKQIAHLPASKKHYDTTANMIKLFLLGSDLSVREIVYTGPRADGADDGHFLENDILRSRKRYPGAPKTSSLRSLDGFIVDDWDESALGANTAPTLDKKLPRSTPLASLHWTVDYSHVYEIAIGSLTLSKEDEGLHIRGKCLQDLIEGLKVHPTNHTVSQTLLEAFKSSCWRLDDIDQNARDLKAFLSSLVGTNPLWITPDQRISILCPPDIFGVPSSKASSLEEASATGTLVNIYDRLVNDWLAILPYGIPGRTRIMKEKIIRSVAAELALAQISLTHSSSQEEGRSSLNAPQNQTNEPLSDVEIGSEVPLLRERPSFLDDQELGSPGRTAMAGSSAKKDGLPDRAQDLAALCSSLSSLTTFSGKRPVSRSTASMLQHWKLGTDPTTYSWHRTTQMLDGEDSRRVLKSTASQRKPRKKLLGGSQGSNQHLTAPTAPASSAVPVVREWGSQPENSEPPARRLQSSQPVEDDLPMTQVERGMFGGREASRKVAMKTRKKKRAAGF